MTESDVTGFIAVNRLREHGNWWGGVQREVCSRLSDGPLTTLAYLGGKGTTRPSHGDVRLRFFDGTWVVRVLLVYRRSLLFT